MVVRSNTFSFFFAFSSRPMLKGFVWSLALHLLLVGTLFFVTGENKRASAPITVLLTGDLPGPTGGKEKGKITPSEPKKSGVKRTPLKTAGLGYRTAKTYAPSKPEAPSSTFNAAPMDRKLTAPYPDFAFDISHSPTREADRTRGAAATALAGGEVEGAAQASTGQGKKDGVGYDGEGRSGSGQGTGSASGLGRGTGAVGNGADASYLAANFNYIRERILKGLSYPARARQMGWKGRVTVSFVISDSGCVESIRLLESSGHRILDDHTIKTIKNCQPFPKPPVRAEVIIPIVYRIG